MPERSYDPSRQSLFHPGAADDFFQLGTGAPPSEAALCAEMSRLAYVREPDRLAGYLGRAGFQLKQTFSYDHGGTQVFIARRPDDNRHVVAFRGTEPADPSDLLTDADFIRIPWADGTGAACGEVHRGFAKALLKDDLAGQIQNQVTGPGAAHDLLLTGHSLGAALATLLASWLPGARLYTFGSPRVGNAAFAESQRLVQHTRFVDCCDLVTRVPPRALLYVSTGTLHYIDRHRRVVVSPDPTAVAADRRHASLEYLAHQARQPGAVLSRELADHSPINYVTAVLDW